MASGKTRKSIEKRFKFTKDGRVLRLATGLNHLRSKKSGKQKRKKKWIEVSKGEAKIIKRYRKTG